MKLLKIVFFGVALLTWILLGAYAVFGDSFLRKSKEIQAEAIGTLADRYIAENSAAADPSSSVKTVAGLHHIPITVEELQPNVYRATGVANSFLIRTSEGNVLFDGGLGTQAAKQKRLLQNVAPEELKVIILSHSHADHLGATKFWQAEFPDVEIVTHRKFLAGQRYLYDLQDHFWNRNRLLYTFMPETPPDDDAMFAYGGIVPSTFVDDHSEYRFTLGETEFVVLPTPGAEGEDNVVLWLPESRALFSGDFFGPLFPMVPNLFTLRGERFRDPMAYVDSLNTLIDLKPAVIYPSHFDPIRDPEQLDQDMRQMRDATRYIHDATIEGMNQGKSVWQLMDEITLPGHLNISQGHGKVSWNVRSIWEFYSTWFKFESTTELYSVPASRVYPDITSIIDDKSALLALASQHLEASQPEKTLHLIEIYLSSDAEVAPALELRLNALQQLLARAKSTTNNFSETGWLQSRIDKTQNQLNSDKGSNP